MTTEVKKTQTEVTEGVIIEETVPMKEKIVEKVKSNSKKIKYVAGVAAGVAAVGIGLFLGRKTAQPEIHIHELDYEINEETEEKTD